MEWNYLLHFQKNNFIFVEDHKKKKKKKIEEKKFPK